VAELADAPALGAGAGNGLGVRVPPPASDVNGAAWRYGWSVAAPEDYIAALDEPRRSDIQRLHDLIRETLPELEPNTDGGMLGYGRFHYRYASGREGDASLVALSSRKQYISLYVLCADERGYLAERYAERLPKTSIGKSCVRFKRTSDVDLDALRDLLVDAGRLGHPAAVT
jgi:Domain of unknown function (DU1801)